MGSSLGQPLVGSTGSTGTMAVGTGKLGLCTFQPAVQDPVGLDCEAFWKNHHLGSVPLSSFRCICRRCICRRCIFSVTAAASPCSGAGQHCRKGSSSSFQPRFPFLSAPERPLHPFPLHHLLGRQCQAGERLPDTCVRGQQCQGTRV